MRRAISPRLAIRIFLNIVSAAGVEAARRADRVGDAPHSMTKSGWPNSTAWPFSHRISRDRPGGVGLDLVHDLHRLDDADRVADLDRAADLDERLGARAGRAVEGADHRRLDDVAGRRRRLRRRVAAAARSTGAAITARRRVAAGAAAGAACADAFTIRTLPSASVISSSEMFDSETRSIKVFSLRRSIEVVRDRELGDAIAAPRRESGRF